GITKAYTTRVGSGPFPTELFDSIGEHLQTVGNEKGTTTGRSRRCGWFDAMLVKHAIRVNSINTTCLTKRDVLAGSDASKASVGYEDQDGNGINVPASADQFEKIRPVYN